MNWVVATLDSLPIEIIDGDRSAKYPKREEFRDEGMPFLNSTNIVDNRLDLTETNFVSMEKYSQIRKGRFQAGDILMTTRGSIGKVAWMPPGLKGLINAQMLILRVDPNALDGRFLFSVLSSDDAQQSLKNFASGSAQPQIPIRDLRQISVQIPDLITQRRIASILSAYDDLIENNTRRIAILEEMARRLYEEWFVRFRFPGHEGVPLVESELGLVPQGWQRRSLDTFGEVITGKTPSKANPDFYGDDVPFVKTPDMHGNAFVLVSGESLSLTGAKSQSKKTLPPDSLCVSCIGTIGVVSITTEPCQTNQQINSIVLSDVVAREFLFLRLKDAKKTLENLGANGATMGNVNKRNFAAMEITAPPLKLLVRFHELAEPMFDLMRALARKNQNLRTTRDLLLPKLISGELDVSTLPEPQAETA